MKKLLSILLSLFLIGCAGNIILPSKPLVNESIKSIYHASVSIIDGLEDVHGSGVIIYNRAGHKMVVLTAAHVVTYMQKAGILIRVLLPYKAGWKAMVLKKIDIKKDLALLEGIENEKLNGPEVKIAEQYPHIGDRVTVIGAPMGHSGTVTKGILANIQQLGSHIYYRVSAPVFFGNSGGGCFNKSGELIGIAHAIQSFGFTYVPGAGFFIPLEEIKKFL
jgi:serine protease Do